MYPDLPVRISTTRNGVMGCGPAIFIPPREVLSWAAKFHTMYAKYALEVDETYDDIIMHAYGPALKFPPTGELGEIMELIQRIVGGEVIEKAGRFHVRQRRGTGPQDDMEMHLVAEGHRKLALLWLLLRNGSLPEAKVLYWDEPEANMNPSMVQHVAHILMVLARHGVQIFLASHHYALLKEIDLQKRQAPVKYFALDDSGADGVTVTSWDHYAAITPNKIAEEYLRIYDQELEHAFGG
ncbi:MAG: ATP-binding protein [Magnetococcus sp. WYHC-3]